ncbi:alpha/beta hydrolase [Ideonella sp. DXS29W]|uniref:Alpha/beta hydrolase n=1 Tax=Ideonella lacteola TaxID=2984193 RepID=A0ABU9BX64_9BURK
MATPTQLLFLPGASGMVDFWQPVAERLVHRPTAMHHLGWPGIGATPAAAGVRTLSDLVDRVLARIDQPTALVAQSMGAVVALRAAMTRPVHLTHLVLAGLSGGVDLRRFGATDWRPPSEQIDPDDPTHLFAAYCEDLSAHLHLVESPALLLCGDADPLSPPPANQWVASSLRRARCEVIKGGGHTFARTHAAEVAASIDAHLANRLD